MTPTLYGRWQTRLLLLLTVGVLISLPFVLFFGLAPLKILGLVIVLGFVWDIVYDRLQKFRWDRDWPPAFQFFAGVWEGVATYLVARLLRVQVPLVIYVLDYGLIWLAIFLITNGPMRILFPRWRYRGGQWI